MIQDIAPHRFERAYTPHPAERSDYAVCVSGGAVLLERSGAEWHLPRFAALGAVPADGRYLFSLDGTGCFSASAPEEAAEGCEYVPIQKVRGVRPMETAFAALTGAQLVRWYESRAFCGRCGAAAVHSTQERAMVCPACGQTEYPKLCPAVIVAVTDGDRLLLTRYRDRPYRGDALVAGFAEIGETLEDTVRREVAEEVGLQVKNVRYYKSQPWALTDTLLAGFYCELSGADTITLEEAELKEGFWVRRAELTPHDEGVSLTSEMIERFRLGEID
ncbi:MAG: NAD(+) diphosphatase [Oscillospiraceae bacterium]|nr:NAD(+) diphosphatase [Oscillospiraceae bacterium]